MNDTTRTTPAATMGRRIAETRKSLELTQQDLADRVGVTPQAVSKWETDASLPDIGLLASLATTLGLTLDQLVTGEGYHPAADAAPAPRANWGKILGTVTEDIHGDVGTIVGDVQADIYGDVRGDITGTVRNIYGNVEGKIVGEVHGDITGYVGGHLIGIVDGRVKLGVRGKILGTIIGDGINVDQAAGVRRGRKGAARGTGRGTRAAEG